MTRLVTCEELNKLKEELELTPEKLVAVIKIATEAQRTEIRNALCKAEMSPAPADKNHDGRQSTRLVGEMGYLLGKPAMFEKRTLSGKEYAAPLYEIKK